MDKSKKTRKRGIIINALRKKDDSDYRRGYSQGFFECWIYFAEFGFDKTEIKEFINGPLYQWRFSNDRFESLELPPQLKSSLQK